MMEWQSIYRQDLFSGKVALVTGGGTGIGRAIATELAILGANVVVASRDEAVCKKAADEINKTLPDGCLGCVVAGPATNIRKEDQVEKLVAWTIQTQSALDLLVNNAGGQFISPAEEISKNGMSAVVETNLVGTFLLSREAYNQYMEQHGGSIVNITLGNRNGMPMMMHSGAARAGVENMSATLCTEWVESGVRVNCVRPGIIWTESGFENYGAAGDMFVDKILPSIPAKRFGSAQEVSSAVVWLLSEGASYVTGAIVAVCGGSSYTFLPLVDIPDHTNLPHYGQLPRKAKL